MMADRIRLFTFIALATAAGASTSARADPTVADPSLQTQLFGKALGPQHAHACFRRAYDSAHLARHPHQNVRTMVLLVTGYAQDGRANVALGLRTTFRTKGVDLTVGGGCGHEGETAGGDPSVAHCGVDCDGGSIDIALKDKGQVLVTIPQSAGMGSEAGAAPDKARLRRQFAADDKVFLLDRTTLDQCLPLAEEDDRASMRKGL